MLDTLLVGAADAERDHRRYVLDDGADAVLDRGKGRIEPHRHVAAADIKAHTGDADLPLIGDDAADRLGIAEMAISADDTADDIAHPHTVAHLSDCRVVVAPEHPQRAVRIPRRLRRIRRDRPLSFQGFGRKMFFARRVTVGAPCRHGSLPRPLNAAVRIDAGGKCKLAGASLVGIGLSHNWYPLCRSERIGARIPKMALTYLLKAGRSGHRKILSSPLLSLPTCPRPSGKVTRPEPDWHRRRDLNPDGRFWRPQCCHYITPVYQTAESNRADGVHSAVPYHPIGLSGRDGGGHW